MVKKRVNILLVDDKDSNLIATEELLASDERNILKALTGEEALKIASTKDIDLIILDVHMPDMDGFEVAQLLKMTIKTKSIPIIFATAEKKEHNFMMRGIGEGAIDYLFKPLDPELTIAKVNSLLKFQVQNKELQEKNKILEKYALLINNCLDLMCTINTKNMHFEEVNHAFKEVLGYELEEIRNSPLKLYLFDEDAAKVESLKNSRDRILDFETQVKCRNGEIKWLHWHVVVKDGKWFANARNISGQKKSEDEINALNNELQKKISQLQSINHELESFSYSVSHDLRAPLRAIVGYSRMIKKQQSGNMDNESLRLFGNIEENAKRMGVLIDDLLEFSRLGRMELKKVMVNMTELLESSLEVYDEHLRQRTKIIYGQLLPASADYNLIRQVFINLLSNAFKYSAKKENPVIEIGSLEENHQTIYFVKDNGAGFNMKYADKLFGVFERLHTHTEFEGTGVGLAIVQRIVNKHGGSVWAEAKVDEGATFYFSLPK